MKMNRILQKQNSQLSGSGFDFWDVLAVIGLIINALLRLVRQSNEDIWERRD